MPDNAPTSPLPPGLAEADILEAMRGLGGYLDISPADALAIYRLAYDHALARLARDIPVRDIMTTRVARATPATTARQAADIMAGAGVSGLPVCDGDAVVGVVSLKNLLRLLDLPAEAGPAALVARLLDPATCGAAGAAPSLGLTPVAALMTSPALTVDPDTPRSRAARIMAETNVNRLPVVDAAGLVGIVSRGDVVRSCRSFMEACAS